MTSLLRRVPARAAISLIVAGVVVLFLCVIWLAQRAGLNDDADQRQAGEIALNQSRLDNVSDLARDLKSGLTKANQRLRANGVAPVAVPTTTVEGAAGSDGVDGTPGTAGRDGRDGSDGATGQPGSPGPTGAPGTGTTGQTGPQGPQGPKGDAGATGPQGTPGKDGADGTDGTNGQDGAPGQPGQPGVDGKPPTSFTFTDALGVTYVCADPETDGDYSCRAS